MSVDTLLSFCTLFQIGLIDLYHEKSKCFLTTATRNRLVSLPDETLCFEPELLLVLSDTMTPIGIGSTSKGSGYVSQRILPQRNSRPQANLRRIGIHYRGIYRWVALGRIVTNPPIESNHMKTFLGLAIVAAIITVGCHPPMATYSTVKTGPDRYMVTGPDPATVYGYAYKACKDSGEEYVDFEVLTHDQRGLQVRCVKPEKTFSQHASEAWETVRKKVNELSKEE